MADLYTIEGSKLRLNFHRGQWKAWQSDRRFIAVLAGTQGGKTSYGPWWLWREIHKRGAGDYLAVTSTYDLFKLKMLPVLREVFERVLKCGRYWAGDRILEIADPSTGKFWAKSPTDPMWARIILRSAESESGLEATTAKAAWLDEAGQPQFQITTWEAILRRLSLNLGRALLTTTVYNLGWLKRAVYERWRTGDPNFEVVQFDSTENPQFPKEEAERAKASMPLWRYDMQYRGRFTRPAGLIYDSFDEALHSIPRINIPDRWPRYLGLDFGVVNTAATFYANEPGTRKLYLYRTYKAGGRSAAEHAFSMLKGEPGIPTCVGGSWSEDNWREEYRLGGKVAGEEVPGLPVMEPDIKEVEVGIDRVYGAHKRGEILVFDDLDDYLDEKRSYSRVLDAGGEPTDKIEAKETYHLIDSERYIVGWFFGAGEPSISGPGKVLTPERRTPIEAGGRGGPADRNSRRDRDEGRDVKGGRDRYGSGRR